MTRPYHPSRYTCAFSIFSASTGQTFAQTFFIVVSNLELFLLRTRQRHTHIGPRRVHEIPLSVMSASCATVTGNGKRWTYCH